MSTEVQQDASLQREEADAAPPPSSADPGRVRRRAVRLGKAVLVVMAGYYALCLALLVAYRFASPPITGLQFQRCVESWVRANRCRLDRTNVAYSRIPTHVSRAVIAAEDGRFWRHWGFDFEEMRVASMDVFDGEIPRGASTITQQLMKNLFGGSWRNPVRKLYDVTLTLPAELILGKQRILELYLNNVEWGPASLGSRPPHDTITVRARVRSHAHRLRDSRRCSRILFDAVRPTRRSIAPRYCDAWRIGAGSADSRVNADGRHFQLQR